MQLSPSRPNLRLVASNGEIIAPPAGATLAERLLDFAGVRPGLRVIEFTFGPGRLGWRFLSSGCEVVSVDLSELPANSIPEEWLGAFDLAVTACALHQVKNPQRLLADVASCVRPGGICAGLEPAHTDFDSPDLRDCATSAGLALFHASEQTPNSALFWRAQVPTLQFVPAPTLSLAA
ncbi:MAG TPA: class I SAM-dependent methyltransferase [Dehalococcoidia bacterium]|nr:class I SAM-dependent methyltransferase [Dehalococcoidia bacterium]